jgi:hypothetical protein
MVKYISRMVAMSNVYKISTGKLEGKGLLRRHRHRRENENKINLIEII